MLPGLKEETKSTSKNFKIMNTQLWTWRSDGNTEIDYIMTDKPSMVTDVTVINRVTLEVTGMGSMKHQSGTEEASKQEYTNKS